MNDKREATNRSTPEIDPVTLEILRNQLESVATEMGHVLIRGAYSPKQGTPGLFDGAI